MSDTTSRPDRHSSMKANASFGLPVARGSRWRLLKRLVARLSWPVLRPQVEFNRELLGEMVRYDDILEDVLRDRDLLREEVELAHQQSFARLHDAVGIIRTEMGDVVQEIRAEMANVARENSEGNRRVSGLAAKLDQAQIRLAQIDLLLNRVRRSLPDLPAAEELASLPSAFENLYGAFVEVFRGPREVIKERVRGYLEDILAVDSALPVLDVGCGRGELLELLVESGAACYGIESNPLYVETGKELGLDIRLADAAEHLEGLKERSLRAVTAIQVAEHMTTEELIRLLDLAVRAIEPGGMLILETPNPENLAVGASSFYLDPTHQQPLPPQLLAFLVEARGFTDVEVRLLERPDLPVPGPWGVGEAWADDIRRVLDLVNSRLFNAQDYAVLARRP
ncbi:MAG TPA: methyltransferase domain-containing protein [Acidimicrobiales bacterium]|nr:methyltransferase domain-containing protein [Acidimicrobiales bacterium]